MPGPDAPQMQIGDPILATLQAAHHRTRQRRVGPHVEQCGSRRAHQSPGPVGDHAGADDAHQRIHPDPAQLAAGKKARNGENRHRRVGQHVDIGRPEIQVAVMACCMIGMVVVMIVRMRLAMIVAMTVIMIMLVTQQPGAGQIHAKAEHGHRNRFVESNRHGMQQTAKALPGDEQGNHRQDNGRSKGCEVAQLAGAEGKALIMRMAPGIGVGERGDEQGACMGAHVQPVGDQGHRAEQRSATDLRHHHGTAQRDDDPGLSLVAGMVGAEEQMLVAEVVQGMAMHVVEPHAS